MAFRVIPSVMSVEVIDNNTLLLSFDMCSNNDDRWKAVNHPH